MTLFIGGTGGGACPGCGQYSGHCHCVEEAEKAASLALTWRPAVHPDDGGRSLRDHPADELRRIIADPSGRCHWGACAYAGHQPTVDERGVAQVANAEPEGTPAGQVTSRSTGEARPVDVGGDGPTPAPLSQGELATVRDAMRCGAYVDTPGGFDRGASTLPRLMATIDRLVETDRVNVETIRVQRETLERLMSGRDRENVLREALYEIARMFDMPAQSDPVEVSVPRGVKKHLGMLRKVADELGWTRRPGDE